MTRVRKLYKTWCKENEQFFNKDKLKAEYTQDAKQALIIYLRNNNVTITEAQFALTEITHAWNIAMYFISCFVGAITGSLFTGDNIIATIIWSVIWLGICYFPLKQIIWKHTKDLNSSQVNLLHITLESYKEMYANEMDVDRKMITLWNGQKIAVPHQAEELYEQKMRNPKYYRNAYLVSIHAGNQDFEYIWYTNTRYKKLNPNTYQKFLDACEEQIGMKWTNIDKAQIEIKDLTCKTNPTSR